LYSSLHYRSGTAGSTRFFGSLSAGYVYLDLLVRVGSSFVAFFSCCAVCCLSSTVAIRSVLVLVSRVPLCVPVYTLILPFLPLVWFGCITFVAGRIADCGYALPVPGSF
jgi:hypothetical protein